MDVCDILCKRMTGLYRVYMISVYIVITFYLGVCEMNFLPSHILKLVCSSWSPSVCPFTPYQDQVFVMEHSKL